MVSRGIREHLAVWRSDDGFQTRGLPEPTQAPPGSTEKINILAARLDAGYELHHPEDIQATEGKRKLRMAVQMFSQRRQGRDELYVTTNF